MTWLRIDDGFSEHEKVQELHDRAFRLHVVAMCYCARNLTDGYLAPKAVKVCGAIIGTAAKRWPAELVAADLWIPDGTGGFAIKDYLHYNPAAADVKKDRAGARERMRALREFRRSSSERSDEHVGERSPEGSGSPSPVPSQSPFTETAVGDFEQTKAVRDLLTSMRDKDEGSEGVVKSLIRKYKLSTGDLYAARDAARGKGVVSPAKVAVAELKKRGESRNAA